VTQLYPDSLILAALPVFISFSSMMRPPPSSTLFPYTTLFRSRRPHLGTHRDDRLLDAARRIPCRGNLRLPPDAEYCIELFHLDRSEEHTSELQSRENLVCRLLLEKKNNTITCYSIISRFMISN